MRRRATSRFVRLSRVSCLLACGLLCLAIVPRTIAGLVVNEIFRTGVQGAGDYVEFLVTSDMTLAQLDTIWFGDSGPNTGGIEAENNFNSAQIVQNSNSFNSTSDVLQAGTLIVVGGPGFASDLSYNPGGDASSDWNITLTLGNGIDGSGSFAPFRLDQNGDVIWLSSSQPSAGAGFDDIFSAVGYDSSPGALGQFVENMEQTDPGNYAFLTGDEFDGSLNRLSSLSNSGGATLSFDGSEGLGGTPGQPNGGANFVFVSNLRAVPEPSTFLPCLAILCLGLWLRFRKSGKPGSQEPETGPSAL